jgi:hypothetical protein
MKLRHAAALSAALGLAAPVVLHFIAYCCADTGRWAILWPTFVTAIWILPLTNSTATILAFTVGLNMLLYAVVGTVLWYVVAVARRLLAN